MRIIFAKNKRFIRYNVQSRGNSVIFVFERHFFLLSFFFFFLLSLNFTRKFISNRRVNFPFFFFFLNTKNTREISLFVRGTIFRKQGSWRGNNLLYLDNLMPDLLSIYEISRENYYQIILHFELNFLYLKLKFEQ